MGTNEHLFLKQKRNEIPSKLETIHDYLFLANIFLAIQETLYFKLKQIDSTEYNWLTPEVMDQCHARMEQIIAPDCQNHPAKIETTIINDKQNESHVLIDAFLQAHFGEDRVFRFNARVDLITETTVWEIKCTSKIMIDHMLQVAIYQWLWEMSLNPSKTFRIFNIKSGEMMRLDATLEQLNEILLKLLKGKYQEEIAKTDETFVTECRREHGNKTV